MKAFAERLVALLWRWPLLLLFGVLVISAGAAWFAKDLRVAHSLEVWFDTDSTELMRYRNFTQRWGNDEIAVISLPTAWEPGAATSKEIVAALGKIDGVAQVFSLLDMPTALAEQAQRFLSTDGEQQLVALQMQAGSEFEASRHRVLGEIRAVLASLAPHARLSGVGVIYDALNELSTRGAVRLLLICDALLILLLCLFYRRALAVAVTLLCVGLASLWTMGLFAACGFQINMVTMTLPTVVMVMGIADCVHILRSVARQPTMLAQATRVQRGIADVFVPCLVTTLTTAAGFLALASAGIPAVGELGLFAAIGVAFSLVLALLVCILALRWRQAEPRVDRADLAGTIALWLCSMGVRRPLLVCGLWLGFALLAIHGTRDLAVDTNSFEYLPENHTTSAHLHFIEANFGPFLPLEFIVSLPPGTLEADAVVALHGWQQTLASHPRVGWTWSVASLFTAPGTLSNTAQADREIQGTRDRYPRLWQNLVADRNTYRVTAGIPALSARQLRVLIDELEASAQFVTGSSVHAAGYLPLYASLVDTLVRSQLQSFVIALALIIVLLGIFLRSRRLGLLALLANLLPVLLTLGLMGQLGIPIDIATVTIASVVLGLIVDDTVHFLHGVPRTAAADQPLTVVTAARETGGALVTTTIVLAGGFAVLGLADLKSITWFGSLTAFAAGTAVLVDLMLLPALLQLSHGRRLLPGLTRLSAENNRASH